MSEKPTADPLIGVMVGRYQIDRLIGQGGMGRVYAAVQRDVGSRVAIKVLNEEYARDRDLAERFFAEARAVNLIAHENIVSVLDLVRLPDARPVIIMELLEGQTLRDLVQDARAPLGAVVHVMIEVLSAIAAAHGVGIVHRDLKPDNILVSPSGRAKVLDFGIAKLVTAEPGKGPRTRTGALVGTPDYMAPEQIGGRAIDARTDIYSAGVVLFEAMTGRRPFEGQSDFEVMRAHVDSPPPSVRTLRADIPVEIEAVVVRALAKAPGDRFATATEMANALQAASATLPESAWRSFSSTGRAYTRPAPLTPPERRPAHERPTLAAAGALGAPPRALGATSPTVDETPRDLGASSPTIDQTPRARGREVNADVVATVPLPAPPTRSRATPIALAFCVLLTIGGVTGIVLRQRHSTPTVTSGKVTTIERPATYDPKRFDPVAYYPTALDLARTFIPDAQLMFLKAVPAHEDGTIDLTQATAKQNVYLYRSASAAAALNGERDCVGVEPYPDKVLAFVYPSTDCDYPLVTSSPRCTITEVWTRARAQRDFANTTAHIGFFGEDRGPAYWYLDPSLARRTGAGVRIEDDCR